MTAALLHIGTSSPAGIAIALATIFLFIFALSFAVGSVPEGGRRLSTAWVRRWFVASLPRLGIAGAFTAAAFIAAWAITGSDAETSPERTPGAAGSAICERPVPPLTNEPITRERLDDAIEAMRGVAEAAAEDDLEMARWLFLARAHDITHDMDPPLREVDEPLAIALCDAVLALEVEMVREPNLAVIAREADTAAALMVEAGERLGLSR
jgi:hypothetical protein